MTTNDLREARALYDAATPVLTAAQVDDLRPGLDLPPHEREWYRRDDLIALCNSHEVLRARLAECERERDHAREAVAALVRERDEARESVRVGLPLLHEATVRAEEAERQRKIAMDLFNAGLRNRDDDGAPVRVERDVLRERVDEIEGLCSAAESDAAALRAMLQEILPPVGDLLRSSPEPSILRGEDLWDRATALAAGPKEGKP